MRSARIYRSTGALSLLGHPYHWAMIYERRSHNVCMRPEWPSPWRRWRRPPGAPVGGGGRPPTGNRYPPPATAHDPPARRRTPPRSCRPLPYAAHPYENPPPNHPPTHPQRPRTTPLPYNADASNQCDRPSNDSKGLHRTSHASFVPFADVWRSWCVYLFDGDMLWMSTV